MKIYVLSSCEKYCDGGYTIDGAYSTREKAEKQKPSGSIITIDEIELDKALIE